LRIYNIDLNVKFHFALELRGFADCVCVFRLVCRDLIVLGILAGNVCKQSRKTVCTVGLVTSLEIIVINFESLCVNGDNCVVVVFNFRLPKTSASQCEMCFNE